VLDERYRSLAKALDVSVVPKRGLPVAKGRTWAPRLYAPRVRTHTVALRLEHQRRRVHTVPVFDLKTETVKQVRARAVILCASPIETARILLESELGPGAERIGRGFVDHMVAGYVLIEPAAPPSREGRGVFPGSALVESSVGGKQPYPGGFSIELRGPVTLESLDIERMAPPGEEERTRATLIHAIGETAAIEERYVDLDPSKRDLTGRRVPRVHVAFSKAEEQLARDMKKACRSVADALAIPGSRVIAFGDPLQAGAGHEAGTVAMGVDEAAPADVRGRLRALENVWVADSSALPTAGDRHPTLTALAHALRAADDAAKFLQASGQ
jgi:choline dehydrogenase-like flavoprotein